MIHETIQHEFRRAVMKNAEQMKFFKTLTWITLSASIVLSLFLFHYNDCETVLFEHERSVFRKTDVVQIVNIGMVVDYDVFQKDDVYHGFRTVRMNTSGGYPVTCTIPFATGSDAKEVEGRTSFEAPFETGVVWLDTAGLCKEWEQPHQQRRLTPVLVGEAEACSTYQVALIVSLVSLILCWLGMVVWDHKLVQDYNLSDFLKNRKDLTDLLKSYEAERVKGAERGNCSMRVTSSSPSFEGDV